MKLTVIGGGGVRSMFLAKTLAQKAKEINLTELVFMDDNEQKLSIYGSMAQQVVKLIDPDINFSLTLDPIDAVTDADYVITTIRVGGDEQRVQDERSALDLGVLGQETTGAAGFSFAMRSVPALVKYCELIKKYSKPSVKVFNFTNPAGLVSQCLRDMGYSFTFGICDAPSGLLRQCAALYDVPVESVSAECYGLNHLSFFNKFSIDGKDMLDELLDNERLYNETEMCYFEPKLAKKMGCLINEYLYYYIYREQSVQNVLSSPKIRSELISEVNKSMTEELSKISIESDFPSALKIFEKWYDVRESAYMSNETGKKRNKPAFTFDVFSTDVGGYAGVAIDYIKAEQTGKSVDMVLCVPNENAIPQLEPNDTVEIMCTIQKDGYVPHKIENAGEIQMEYIKRVKYYERTAANAIINQDKEKAIDALTMHPLVNSYSLAEKLVDKYEKINKDYFTFKK